MRSGAVRDTKLRAMVAILFSVGALGWGGAAAQSFTDPRDAAGVSRDMTAPGRSNTSAGLAGGDAGAAGDSEARPTAAIIIARMLEMNQQRLGALEHYESERIYRVEYHGTGGMHEAQIKVHAEYTGPNHKRLTVVEESGSKFICDKVLRKLVESEQEATDKTNRSQTTLSPENYDAELVGEDVVGGKQSGAGAGVRAWVLQVTPKVDNKFTYRGKVWISQDDFAVIRIVGEPAKSPSWWINRASIDSEYVRRGDVWLPAKNVSTSHVRIGGEAKLTIDYGKYPVVTVGSLKPDGPVRMARVEPVAGGR